MKPNNLLYPLQVSNVFGNQEILGNWYVTRLFYMQSIKLVIPGVLLLKKSFSDISGKCILPHKVRSTLIIFGKIHFLLIRIRKISFFPGMTRFIDFITYAFIFNYM